MERAVAGRGGRGARKGFEGWSTMMVFGSLGQNKRVTPPRPKGPVRACLVRRGAPAGCFGGEGGRLGVSLGGKQACLQRVGRVARVLFMAPFFWLVVFTDDMSASWGCAVWGWRGVRVCREDTRAAKSSALRPVLRTPTPLTPPCHRTRSKDCGPGGVFVFGGRGFRLSVWRGAPAKCGWASASAEARRVVP